MTCARHGVQRPSFVCRHLQHGEGLRFHQADALVDAELSFKNAWCEACNQVLLEEGGWNDTSEGFAGIMLICEGCFGEISRRNLPAE